VANYDSADLLDRLRQEADRPTSDADLTDAKAYRLLSDAQLDVTMMVAQHIPHLMYGAPALMTSADEKVYTLPGSPTPEWIGPVEVYPALGQQPLIEGSFWDDAADFTREGPSTIRICGNRTRTFSDGPYVRYVAKPTVISASVEPTLYPVEARLAVVKFAAAKYARQGGFRSRTEIQEYQAEAMAILWGRDGIGGVIPPYKQGAVDTGGQNAPWYYPFRA
jgi:hypothetical protein